jgi:hypothetical protein
LVEHYEFDFLVLFTKYEADKSKEDKMGGQVACMGELRNAYETLDGKYERKIPIWIPRHACKDNIKMNFKEMGCDDME